MRYLLLLAYEPGGWEQADEAGQQAYFDAHHAFEAYVTEHGKHLGSAALADTDVATTVRHEGGRTVVSDGPFVETTEIVGGYYDVDLPDLDTAIAAAALLPPSYAVEIRPTVTIEGYEGV
ncbi:YciI family protein [Nocardioides aestuarii]|uniref:YciI family protein n=1 Tax=Nocardioides aestuarii TaxID=252231 RepID=A0ABW4TQM4_9ACTN